MYISGGKFSQNRGFMFSLLTNNKLNEFGVNSDIYGYKKYNSYVLIAD